MTLRVTIEIVPHGNEENKYPIFKLDISNTKLIRNEGFGHEICEYEGKLYNFNNETIQRISKVSEWELSDQFVIPEHDRRDGALALVKKAIEAIENVYESNRD